MLDHQKEFMEFHKRRVTKTKKSAYLTKTHLENEGRKKINAQNKAEVDRINALKRDDIDAYINLISTEKNSRLMTILE